MRNTACTPAFGSFPTSGSPQVLWCAHGTAPESRAYNVVVRRPACIVLLLLLAACRSGPTQHQNAVVDQKKSTTPGTIHVGDFLATPENCGMIQRGAA